MTSPLLTSRTQGCAATLRLAASSVAPVAFGYERSRKAPSAERHCETGVSRALRTICKEGGL